MAISGLNVNGAFPVYDTSSVVNNYAKTIQKQQAQRQAEQKALQDQLSKVKLEGVRDPDKPEFYEKYTGLKDLYSTILTEKNPLKKMEAQADFDRKFMELADFGDKSGKAAKDDDDFSSKLLDDRFRNQFSDDAVLKAQRNRNLPISHPDYVADKSVLERQIDTSKILDDFAKLDDQVMQTTSRYISDMNGTKVNGGREFKRVKQGDVKAQEAAYLAKYNTDRTTKAFIQREYADLFDQMPEEEASRVAIQDIIKNRPLVREEAPRFEKDDNWRQKADYAEHLRRTRPDKDGNVEAPETVRQDLVQGLLSKDGKARNILQAQVVANPEYGGKNVVIKFNKNGTTSYEVPPKLDDEGEVKQNGYTITIEEGKEASAVALNQLLNDVTGEKVPYGGYKGVKGNKNKSPNETKSKMSSQDQAALNWANQNSKDPRAIAIKKALKSKGLL